MLNAEIVIYLYSGPSYWGRCECIHIEGINQVSIALITYDNIVF